MPALLERDCFEKMVPPDSSLLGSYDTILRLEDSLSVQTGCDASKDLIYARILGYLLIHAPSEKARAEVRRGVELCLRNDDPDISLLELGKHYLDFFIRPFKGFKDRTPIPSEYVSPPSFDTLKDIVKKPLVQNPNDYTEAKNSALIRDGFRCIITGAYHNFYVQHSRELRTQLLAEKAAGKQVSTDIVQCTHILAKPLNLNAAHHVDNQNRCDHAASVWELLERFGFGGVIRELEGLLVHRLENILTLAIFPRDLFDSLNLWFEATCEENRYKVGTTDEDIAFAINRWPKYVTFTTTDQTLALPSKVYLSLHAACAKVAQLSGASEYLDEIDQERETLEVLSNDGSSAHILESALFSPGTPSMYKQ